jgi:N-acetylglucosamine-6-sulfatase
MGWFFWIGGFNGKSAVAALSLGSPFAAYSAIAGSRPNVVFVLVDDLRWDELGCTEHPFASTPNVDR